MSATMMRRVILLVCACREQLKHWALTVFFVVEVSQNEFEIRTPLRALGRLSTRFYDVSGMEVV